MHPRSKGGGRRSVLARLPGRLPRAALAAAGLLVPTAATPMAPAPPPPAPAVRAARTPATEVEARVGRLAREAGGRAWMGAGLGRLSRHEALIRAALRRHGQPEGLLYLVLVESGGRETAVSRAGAAGLWQFMEGTARAYGLEVSAYVDERRDPVRATDAAVRHLRDLHRRYGSWHLALAAYNCGAGCVDRALAGRPRRPRGDERPYWEVRPRLPRETRGYVPAYLAAAWVARDPAAHGVRVRREPPLAFGVVRVAGGVPLSAVARARGLPPEALLRLNPHLVRGTTPPGRPWPVRVPPPSRGPAARPGGR